MPIPHLGGLLKELHRHFDFDLKTTTINVLIDRLDRVGPPDRVRVVFGSITEEHGERLPSAALEAPRAEVSRETLDAAALSIRRLRTKRPVE